MVSKGSVQCLRHYLTRKGNGSTNVRGYMFLPFSLLLFYDITSENLLANSTNGSVIIHKTHVVPKTVGFCLIMYQGDLK